MQIWDRSLALLEWIMKLQTSFSWQLLQTSGYTLIAKMVDIYVRRAEDLTSDELSLLTLLFAVRLPTRWACTLQDTSLSTMCT